MDAFLAVAEELKITGLTPQRSAANDKSIPSKKAEFIFEESKKVQEAMVSAEELLEVETNEVESEEEVVEILETEDTWKPLMEILKTDDASEPLVEIETAGDKVSNDEEIADDVDLNTKVRSMMDFSENRVMSNKKPGTTMGRARICKVCGKEGIMSSILIHIETKHIAKVASPCDICGMISKSRNGLIQHKAKKHSN